MVENDVDDMTFGVGFTQLVTIRKPPRDHWPDVTNIKDFVGEELKSADLQQGGKISGFVQERLTVESRQALVTYMQG